MKYFIVLVLNFLVLTGFSQTSSIGIRGGGNLTSLNYNDALFFSPAIGLNTGIIFKHFEEKNIGIQLELNYSQRGYKAADDSTNSLNYYSAKFNYIELPFMTQITGGGRVKVFVNIGVNIGYNLGGTETVSKEGVKSSQPYKFTSIDNRFDFGGLVGAGFSISTGIGIFQIEGRGQMSLSKSLRDVTGSNYLIAGVSASYMIPLKAEELQK